MMYIVIMYEKPVVTIYLSKENKKEWDRIWNRTGSNVATIRYLLSLLPKDDKKIMADLHGTGKIEKDVWDLSPDWAIFGAMNENGLWQWFSHRPKINELDKSWDHRQGTRRCQILTPLKYYYPWNESLSPRPEDDD